MRAWVDLDLSIVRGLAYYTGIVFELLDARGEHRAICGGGRYDTLLKGLGGPDLPALGFGMGDVVLGDLLRSMRLLPESAPVPDYFVAYTEPSQIGVAMDVARQLRAAPWYQSTTMSLKHTSLTKQLREADASGARACVVLTGVPDGSRSIHAEVKHLRRIGLRSVHLARWLNGNEAHPINSTDPFTPTSPDAHWSLPQPDCSGL